MLCRIVREEDHVSDAGQEHTCNHIYEVMLLGEQRGKCKQRRTDRGHDAKTVIHAIGRQR
jgi:hypothetical protein